MLTPDCPLPNTMHSLRGYTALWAAIAQLTIAFPLVERNTPLLPPQPATDYSIQLGPRPYYIIQNMTDSPLKSKLESCENGPFQVTAWSIGHRGGGTLQFPEETVQSTEAGARMGAGILECDVSFTSDLGLVCRHDLCDLASTTDILLRPSLAAKCTQPFRPANGTSKASAVCCTSDITLAEFTSLCGKMDGTNTSATNAQDFQHGTPSWRTELYDTCGTVMTLESYIDLVDSLPGYRNFTPELKTPPAAYVSMPFNGTYTQEQYARDMLDTFIRKGIDPARVWPQSFNPPDIFQWIAEYPQFANQLIYLDESGDTPANYTVAVDRLPTLASQGVKIVAPPLNYLYTIGGADNATIVPSPYALGAKAAGLEIISWSFDRSGPLADVRADKDSYYSSISSIVSYDGQLYEVLNVLGNEVGLKALFSDWSATVTYFANCFEYTGYPFSSNNSTGSA